MSQTLSSFVNGKQDTITFRATLELQLLTQIWQIFSEKAGNAA